MNLDRNLEMEQGHCCAIFKQDLVTLGRLPGRVDTWLSNPHSKQSLDMSPDLHFTAFLSLEFSALMAGSTLSTLLAPFTMSPCGQGDHKTGLFVYM